MGCPNASERIFCCVASPLDKTPVIVPSCMTAILSLMPSISGNSDEIMMMALPLKMLARWSFNLKYIVHISEFFFNI